MKTKLIVATIMIMLVLMMSHVLASTYLANTKSGKFHYYDCSTIKYPNAAHFVPYDSREAAIADGYIACQKCRS